MKNFFIEATFDFNFSTNELYY